MLIVVAHDLSPADVIAFKDHRFASFITDVGGSTSHTAIVARSLAIPAVVGLENARALIRDGEQLIVDGRRGVIIVNPDHRVLEEYQFRKNQIELEKSKLKRLKTAKSETIDGVEVRLYANIELPGDVPGALEAGAEGIGLFRTEFLFLDRGDMPDEREQYEAYRKVVKGMGGRPVTIRTFDLGNDKDIHPNCQPGRPRQSQSGARPARHPPVAGRAADVPDAVARDPARLEVRADQAADSDARARPRDRPDAGRRRAGEVEPARREGDVRRERSRSAA